ncbi:hypothetical protein A4U49_06065 [Acidithiobacillus ferrivorans]|uniref:secretion/conjugation apparatus DotM-related subunit n=1 Tax=Acidithiobacillus ferrivorans TaxID=160808 RepID=UPI000892C719|nr:hypothetical protein [Acidithiobacillus ferrivorans]OFA16743.1 hypothetical protein A4U49_06065 [Acidithiobacillus ferrivorans]
MAQAQAGNGPSDDDAMIGIGLGVVALLAMIYFFGKPVVLFLWSYLAIAQIWVLQFFHPHEFAGWIHYLLAEPSGEMSWSVANKINGMINNVVTIPVPMLHARIGVLQLIFSMLPLAAIPALLRVPRGMYQTFRKKGYWKLAKFMSPIFPWVLPVMKYRTIDGKHTRLGKNKGRNPISGDWPLYPTELLRSLKAEGKDGIVNEEPIAAWHEKQLGRPLRGGDFRYGYEAALFNVFALANAGKGVREQAVNQLKELSRKGPPAKVSLNPTARKLFIALRKKHAYSQSILLEALHRARRLGILPSSWFVWLKYENRGLWYALNSLGAPSPHLEGAAAIAHWMEEKHIGTRIEEPAVHMAVVGTTDAADQIQWKEFKKS